MVFRVPLHANSERFGAFDADGFDLAVFSHRFYLQTLTDTRNTLAMQGINPHLSHAMNTMQDATFSQGNAMNRGVADIVFFIELAVIQAPINFVYMPMQGTAIQHVHFLNTATNTEYRNTASNRRRHQRKNRGIAVFIF